MKFICVDITTLNRNRTLDSVSSIGILIGDTDSDSTEFTELRVIHPMYAVDPFLLETAISEFSNILDADAEKYYIANLLPRIDQYLGDNGISDSEELMIVTNNIAENFPILDEIFSNYRVDYTNLTVVTSDKKSIRCNSQAEQFREFFRLFL